MPDQPALDHVAQLNQDIGSVEKAQSALGGDRAGQIQPVRDLLTQLDQALVGSC